MSAILVLICFSLLVAGGFLLGFLWSVRTGQYEDTYTPSVRVLFDENSNNNNKINRRNTRKDSV